VPTPKTTFQISTLPGREAVGQLEIQGMDTIRR